MSPAELREQAGAVGAEGKQRHCFAKSYCAGGLGKSLAKVMLPLPGMYKGCS